MKSWRINLIFLFIILSAAVLISRLIFLQVLNQEYWRAMAKGQQKTFIQIPGERGEIFLQDKENSLYPLAINKEFRLVYIDPNEVKEKEKTAEILSRILSLEKDVIISQIKTDSLYELIKNKLSDKELAEIEKENLPGVHIGKEILRYYPQQTLASHVAGFLSKEESGSYGAEGYYQDILKGEEGSREGERTDQGFFLAFYEKLFPPKEGKDLVLTLDYNIQFKAEKLLEKAKKELEIEGGTIIVMDPQTGEILALSNFPNFNPNSYSEVKDFDLFRNSAIQKIFEPGSSFKPITMAAALDQGKVTPDTAYEDAGVVKIGGYTIYNYDGRTWGRRTMTEVLEKSINTGAVFAESQLGHNLFLEYIKRFGILEKTKIDLEGEIFSLNSNFQEGYEVNFATASFGQGIEMTPMQLARAFAAIANGGKLLKPHVVKKIITDGNEEIIPPEISNSQVIIS